MRVQIFLKFTATVTLVIGLTLILFPAFIADFFLTTPAHGSDIFIRFLGSTLVGYTYLNWVTASFDNLPAMKATMIGNFSTLFIAFLLSIIAVLNHELKTTGVLIILLHLVFALGFGRYAYKLKA